MHEVPSPFAGPGGGGRLTWVSRCSFSPGVWPSASAIAVLTLPTSHSRHRTTASSASSFCTLCRMRPTSISGYFGVSDTPSRSARASASIPCTASSLDWRILSLMALSSVENSIFFRTSACDSFRSYSFLTRLRSSSTIWSFSMLNSSSASTRISEAFSSASCLMKDTIWWICLSTSVSFIFAVGRWTRRVAIDRGFNHTRGGELIGERANRNTKPTSKTKCIHGFVSEVTLDISPSKPALP